MNEWEKVKEIGGRAIALAENFDIDKDSDPPLRATALEDYSDLMGAGLRAIIAAGYAIVPRKPNINIVVAGNDAYNKGHFYDTAQEFRPVWSAMLAAGEVKPEEEGCESGD